MLPIKFLKQAFIAVSIAIALVGTVVLVPFILPITFPIVFLALVVLLVLVLVALLLLLLIVLLLLVKSLPRLLREDLAGAPQDIASANATATSTATQTQAQSQRQIQARGGKSPIPKVRNGSVSSSINSARVDTFRSNRLGSCHEDDHDPFRPNANENEPDTNPTASQTTYANFGIDSPRKHKPYYA